MIPSSLVGEPLFALDRARHIFEWVGRSRMTGAMPPPGSIGEKLGVQVQHLMAKRLRRKV